MDKKVFVAVALCAGIFLLWQNVYLKPYAEQQQAWQQAMRARQAAQAPADAAGGGAAAAPSAEGGHAQGVAVPQSASPLAGGAIAGTASPAEVTIGDQAFEFRVSTAGGTVTPSRFPEYKGQKSENLGLLIGEAGQLEIGSPSPDWAYLSGLRYKAEPKTKDPSGRERVVLAYEDGNVSIRRSYAADPGIFSLDQDISLQFRKTPPTYIFVGQRAAVQVPKEKQENERRQVFFNKAGGQKTWSVTDIDSVKEDAGEGNWVGFSSRYFLNALADRGAAIKPQFQARPLENGLAEASLVYRVPGASVNLPVRMYYGPKEIDVLKKAGHHLEAAVDFGWFTVFAYPLLMALKWFYKYVHNFGIAIILLTVLVKILTYPLTLKSMRSMKEMQRIQPQLARLRERYKDDKEKLNREMLQLMKANGYNPMSGCLPMFIQMPIFIALYNVLYNAIDLYGQPFFGWIHDLSAKDPLYVTPGLLALMMFVQQKMTPSTAADPAQQRMMMMMPVIFGFMMLWLPSGLTLYMLVNSVVSIAMQMYMNRTLGLGKSGAAAAA